MAALPPDWLRHFFTSPLKSLNGIQTKLDRKQELAFSTKFVFFPSIRKSRWRPWPSIGWDIFDFSATTERNSTKLDSKEDLNIIYQICVFWLIRKTRWPPWSLIGWDIFDFSYETAERNSTKLDRKQDLNFLYEVCFFGPVRKNKIAALSDLSITVVHCTQVHIVWPCGPLVQLNYFLSFQKRHRIN